MHSWIRISSALTLSCLWSQGTPAQAQATAAARANITIYASEGGSARASSAPQIALRKISDLNFAEVIPGSTAGQVILGPEGADGKRTPVGGCSLGHGAHHSFAHFQLSTGAHQCLVSLPKQTTITNLDGPGSMQVRDFQYDLDGKELKIGATLAVGANQTGGRYLGQFAVQIIYN